MWNHFYRTQVSLGSGLWVPVSLSIYDTFVKLCWCDSGWWWYQLNTIDDANLKRSQLQFVINVIYASCTSWWSKQNCRNSGWNFADVTLADDDTNSILLMMPIWSKPWLVGRCPMWAMRSPMHCIAMGSARCYGAGVAENVEAVIWYDDHAFYIYHT